VSCTKVPSRATKEQVKTYNYAFYTCQKYALECKFASGRITEVAKNEAVQALDAKKAKLNDEGKIFDDFAMVKFPRDAPEVERAAMPRDAPEVERFEMTS